MVMVKNSKEAGYVFMEVLSFHLHLHHHYNYAGEIGKL